MDSIILWGLGLTLLAGLSTGIGGALAFFTKHTNTKVLATSLGLSAGVMIYVSFMELLTQSQNILFLEMGKIGYWWAIASFLGGMILALIIDRMIPAPDNPHEFPTIERYHKEHNTRLHRTGIFLALVIAIHNFPGGIATFISALSSLKLGIVIAIAIAIHNIPEGIAVSIPIYHATGSRKKAFIYSILAGLAEPLGAIVAWIILGPYLNTFILGITFAIVAGIMVYISIDEILPSAREYGELHYSIYGFIAGMTIMAVSLLLL